MKITLDIPDGDVCAVLYRSTDNGNGPVCAWASGFSWHMSGRTTPHVITKVDGKRYTLDLERGLRMMLTHWFGDNRNFMSPNPKHWDSKTCDAFVQYAAFGEIRYG